MIARRPSKNKDTIFHRLLGGELRTLLGNVDDIN